MHRRTFGVLAGALLAGAVVGVPLTTALAQEETRPPFARPAPGQPMMGAPWGGPASRQATPPRPGPRGAADFDMGRHFIEEMIPHHEDAIRMAELALTRAEHQEIRDLAESIRQTQSAEIAQMRAWYQQWYGAEPGPSRMAQMPNMPGHDLAALEQAESFDKAFIEQMVPHHQMAVMMTSHMAGGVQQAELRDLMAAMGKAQAAEIEQMASWYQTWYGVALPASRPGMGMGMGAGMGPGMGAGPMGPGMGPSMRPGMGMGPGMGAGPMGPGMRPGMWPGMGPGMGGPPR